MRLDRPEGSRAEQGGEEVSGREESAAEAGEEAGVGQRPPIHSRPALVAGGPGSVTAPALPFLRAPLPWSPHPPYLK